MRPTIGRTVHYKLTAEDAEQINRRRTTGTAIAERIEMFTWPEGAQAHIGNAAIPGEYVAAVVVKVWGDECVNLQCLLDGNDTFWVTSAQFSIDAVNGTWDWPPRS